jgi:hypothetical protein
MLLMMSVCTGLIGEERRFAALGAASASSTGKVE